MENVASKDPLSRMARKRLYRAFFVSVFFLSLPWSLHGLHWRFKLPVTHLHLPYQKSWDVSTISEETFSLLAQEFTYLSKGNQCYVFVSQDGNYVLKLFRYRYLRFPILQRIKNVGHMLLKRRQRDAFYPKLNKTMTAASLAYAKAKCFTYLVFCHLNLTKNKLPKTTFHTPKRTFQLPMDQYRFVIQRKVVPFKEAMKQVDSNPEKMELRINSLLNLLKNRAKAGVKNSDPNLKQNFGFLGDEAVEMDFGNYRVMPDDPEIAEKEFRQYEKRINEWKLKVLKRKS
jgi:hypothetical protein